MWIAGRSRSTRMEVIAQAEGGSRVRVEDRPVRASGGQWLGGRSSAAKQRHAIRRVHDRLLAETFATASIRPRCVTCRWREANRGVPDREVRAASGGRRAACRSISGVASGPDRWRDGGRALHGSLVAVLNGMRLCVALPGENAECLCRSFDARVQRAYRGLIHSVIVMDNDRCHRPALTRRARSR